jgi:adenylate kinase family enzyme
MNITLLNMVHSTMFFKNVKLMFLVHVAYVKKRCPFHDLRNKTSYEMWYGHIPSMRHLRVFGSTCYALISKEKRSKLDARSQKCIFFGYSNTTKRYRLYDEENKNFILSRDVIFLESTKKDKTVERQLDHLERFTRVKRYSEFDNKIPHPEGGILILGQSLESPCVAPSPPHEEVPAISSDPEFQLDDVIEKIEKMKLDEN